MRQSLQVMEQKKIRHSRMKFCTILHCVVSMSESAYYEEVMCAQELGTTRVRSRHEHRMRPRMNFNPSPSDP